MISLNAVYPIGLAVWPIPGMGAGGPTMFVVLDSDGNSFAPAFAVLDSDGNSFTVTAAVLDSDGNSFTVTTA